MRSGVRGAVTAARSRGDVNLAARRLEVRRTIVWERPPEGGHRKVVGPPKSGRTRRVAISAHFAEALGRWDAEAVVEGGAFAEGYVWPARHRRSLGVAISSRCSRLGPHPGTLQIGTGLTRRAPGSDERVCDWRA